MEKSRWTSDDYRDFGPGDIICNKDRQDSLRLVIKVDESSIWCTGLVHAAFTEANDTHPVYPMSFREIEEGVWDKLLRLGNLDDYKEYIARVEKECTYE